MEVKAAVRLAAAKPKPGPKETAEDIKGYAALTAAQRIENFVGDIRDGVKRKDFDFVETQFRNIAAVAKSRL